MTGIARAALGTATLLSLALLLRPPPLRAQGEVSTHFVVGGGVVVPRHGGDEELRTGYQLEIGVEAGRSGSVVTYRVEGLYDRFPSGVTLAFPCPLGVACRGETLHERRVGGTLDIVMAPSPAASPLVPYVVGGLGAYWHELTGAGGGGGDGATDFGVDLGVGVRLPRVHAFIELDVHVVTDAADCLPLTVGFRL
ncbi:MAG: hypothetical protein LJF06_09910 [Gemmatimonadetes bacterium]|nr:hypothetical protein [Gemmatimonadota bacterium]